MLTGPVNEVKPFFATLDYPGATYSFATGINDAGTIVGRYNDGTTDHGYITYDGGTTFTTFDYPGGYPSFAAGINDAGVIVGRYIDGGMHHGYIYDNATDTFITIDYPGYSSAAADISDSGIIVGTYFDGTMMHGYIYDGSLTTIDNARFTTFDYPRGYSSFSLGINGMGVIVGMFDDGQQHGYVATPIISDVYEGLVGYYPFINGSGYDWSGNGNHGIIYGAPTATADRMGLADNALNFDGVDDYIELLNEADFDLTEFTIVAEVRVPDHSVENWIITKSGNWYGNYSLLINPGTSASYPGWPGFFHQSASGANGFFVADSPFPVGAYTQIAVTIRPSGEYRGYINGALDEWGVLPGYPSLLNDSPVTIGAGVWGGVSNFFNGDIDEVRIYNRVLSDTEILALYNDNCPYDYNPDQADSDTDGIGDACEPIDSDGDGVADDVDNCPADSNPTQNDSDSDGVGDTCDVCNGYDDNVDTDNDGTADGCDLDDDNDGVPDASDPSPFNPYVCADTDSDTCDDCISGSFDPANDGTDTDVDGLCNAGDTDDDNDGILDGVDNCPLVSNSDQTDTDSDGSGDACDTDDDNDGVLDGADNCPLVSNPGQEDSDTDGIGDACDTGLSDFDGDGIDDDVDNCYDVANLGQEDVDGDGLGDACDDNSDWDSHVDVVDNCPLETNEDQANLDGDALGDVCDTDADGDGEDAEAWGGTDCADWDNTINVASGNCDIPPVEEERPVRNSSPPDSDEDGVADGVDNCPSVANAGQADADRDGTGDACDACANDADDDSDGDGVCGDLDNCPDTANPLQENMDADGPDGIPDTADDDTLGDVCDTDADGDGQAVPGDCDDLDASVNTDATEVPGNAKDDDCDESTPDRAFDIVFDLSAVTGGSDWLPEPGATVSIRADVVSVSGSTLNGMAFTTMGVTNLPGEYTNDETIIGGDDFTVSFSDMVGADGIDDTMIITANDYGGSITVRAIANITLADESIVTVERDFTMPVDSDADGLPDWCDRAGLTASSDADADGLTALEECRGFMWGPDPGTAQTGGETASHFRTDTTRKDLFVKWTDFSTANPFQVGGAFSDAGIDVHALPASAAPGELNIDAMVVTNDLINVFPFTDGHINKRGNRDWSWDTKGSSTLGDAASYGAPVLYNRSLTGYFEDLPYMNDNSIGGTVYLDPIESSTLEDHNDNGILDGKGPKAEDDGDGVIEGDHWMPGSYTENLSAFDVDGDGYIELPLVASGDPLIQDTNEQTRAEVLRHTVTHEMGHAVGMGHNSDSTCLMYEYSNNWTRDEGFSDYAKGQIQIHND